jgi:hypothetical protein
VIAESLTVAAGSPHLPANWPGWVVIIVVGLLVLSWLLRLLGIGK